MGVISRILLRCLAGRKKAGRKALFFALDMIAEELKKGPRGGRENSEAAVSEIRKVFSLALHSVVKEIRSRALELTGELEPEQKSILAEEMVRSEFQSLRSAAFKMISSFPESLRIKPIEAAFISRIDRTRKEAMRLAFKLSHSLRKNLLLQAIDSNYPNLSSTAVEYALLLPESENGELLEKAASREPLYLSLAAIDHAESLSAAGKMNILYRGIKNPRPEAALKALAKIDVKDEKPVLPLLVEAVNSEYGKVRGEAYGRIKELSFAAKQYIEPLAAVSAVIHKDKDFLGGLTLKVLYELLKKYDSNFFFSGLQVIYSIKAFSPAMLCKYLLYAAVDIKLFPESAAEDFFDIKKDNQEAIDLIYSILYKERDLIFSLSRDAYSTLYELILQRVGLTEKGSAEYFWQLLADIKKKQVNLLSDGEALKDFIAEPNFPCYNNIHFDQYRKLSSTAGRHCFAQQIGEIKEIILAGGLYSEVADRLRSFDDIEVSCWERILFETLLQVLPVSSYYLTKDKSEKMFHEALSRKEEVDESLGLILPELVDAKTKRGLIIESSVQRKRITRLLNGELNTATISQFSDLAAPDGSAGAIPLFIDLFHAGTVAEFKLQLHRYIAFQTAQILEEIEDKLRSRDVNRKHSALILFQDLLNDTFREQPAAEIPLCP